MNPKLLPALAAVLLAGPAWGRGLELTVNSVGNDNTPDARLTLVEALLLASDSLGRPVSAGESALILEDISGEELEIRFAVPGAGPHFIAAPPGGFPPLVTLDFTRTLIDGYSQPGTLPNTGPVGGTNNAVLKLVLDCRVLAADPVTGETPDYSLRLVGPDIHVRGFSVLASQDSPNYGVYFSDGAAGGQVSGCWFGLSPDQTILSGGEVAIAAYGTEGGHVFGSDGNGVDDLAEVNVIVAQAIGGQFEDTKDIHVQDNLIGVLPDGRTLPPEDIRDALEGDAVEGAGLAGTITLRRNVIGGMRGDVVEFYGPAERLVIQGNWIGVAADGVTPLPNGNFLRVQAVQAVVGAEADAPTGSALSNRIHNHSGYLFRHTRPDTRIEHRGNHLVGNTGPYFELLENSLAGLRLGRDTDLAPVLATNSTRQLLRGTVLLSGPGTNGLTAAVVDVHLAEPGPAPEHPVIGLRLATFLEGGLADLDPLPGAFAFDLTDVAGINLAAHLVVTSTLSEDSGTDTSPFSNLLALPPEAPSLAIARDGDEVVLTWSDPAYGAQFLFGNLADPNGWSDIPGDSPRRAPLSLSQAAFFRLKKR
ncbi:MAG: hypothetical protein ACKVYV_09230 [Limisphaerales bacterium]